MPPTIHLVRHAQGYHNVAKFGDGIHDPFLTDEGVQQAEELREKFPYHDDIDLLMASPMKRTIQTCRLAFKPAVDRGHKIILMPLAQEASDTLMDTGSSEDSIREAFGDDLIDTHRLELFPYWHSNDGRFAVDGETLIERGKMLRRVLRDRKEKNIALVSHGAFAHYIVGNVSKDGEEQTTRMWSNTECRSYEFVGEDDEEAQMKETEESKQRRPELEKESDGYVLQAGGKRKDSLGQAISP